MGQGTYITIWNTSEQIVTSSVSFTCIHSNSSGSAPDNLAGVWGPNEGIWEQYVEASDDIGCWGSSDSVLSIGFSNLPCSQPDGTLQFIINSDGIFATTSNPSINCFCFVNPQDNSQYAAIVAIATPSASPIPGLLTSGLQSQGIALDDVVSNALPTNGGVGALQFSNLAVSLGASQASCNQAAIVGDINPSDPSGGALLIAVIEFPNVAATANISFLPISGNIGVIFKLAILVGVHLSVSRAPWPVNPYEFSNTYASSVQFAQLLQLDLLDGPTELNSDITELAGDAINAWEQSAILQAVNKYMQSGTINPPPSDTEAYNRHE